MAKKPASTKSATIPADLAPGAPQSGESPQKASPIPADALVSESYAERQADGGETHQRAGDGVAVLTTQQGVPVADDQNSLKQGARGRP